MAKPPYLNKKHIWSYSNIVLNLDMISTDIFSVIKCPNVAVKLGDVLNFVLKKSRAGSPSSTVELYDVFLHNSGNKHQITLSGVHKHFVIRVHSVFYMYIIESNWLKQSFLRYIRYMQICLINIQCELWSIVNDHILRWDLFFFGGGGGGGGGGITVYPMLFYAHGFSWWRLQMELFSALLALCGGIHRSPVDSPHTQRPVTRGFDVFFHLSLNKRLSKQSILFETPWRSLWRLCNVLRFSCGLSSVDLSVIRQWDFTRTSTTLQIYGQF